MNTVRRCLALVLSASLVGGCSTAAWYEGLQVREAHRRADTPGAPEHTAPAVSYQEYEKERARLNGAETR